MRFSADRFCQFWASKFSLFVRSGYILQYGSVGIREIPYRPPPGRRNMDPNRPKWIQTHWHSVLSMCLTTLLGTTLHRVEAVGVDLSAASLAIFVELPPDASWLLQAEDRLHRHGQRQAGRGTGEPGRKEGRDRISAD